MRTGTVGSFGNLIVGLAVLVLSGVAAAQAPGGNGLIVALPGGVDLELVLIPAGSFIMGSSDPGWSEPGGVEEPVHQVDIEYDFYMGKYEITQGQWVAVMQSWPHTSGEHGLGVDYPVYTVNWNHCQSFITALNQQVYGTFRLPSEAEWEYCCRAGTMTRFYFGDSICSPTDCSTCDLDNYAWWCGNSGGTTHPVGEKPPNAFGLFDMHGNVHEWCQDYWHDNYTGAPSDGRAWEWPTSAYRILRGGGFQSPVPDADAWVLRSASRGGASPSYWNIIAFFPFGFRVVLDPESLPSAVEDFEVYR